MKKLILFLLAITLLSTLSFAQEYKIITVVESIVPGGIGRSRMIEMKTPMDVDAYTTERTNGKKSGQWQVGRKAVKIDRFAETKLLNFYSLVGINFQNVASNDALVSSKLNQLSAEGWELAFVTSGVESNAGKDDGNGIFVTRYIFKRNNQQAPPPPPPTPDDK